MKVLSSYIFKEIFSYFLICLVIFTTLIFTTRILRLTDLIINQGVELSQVVLIFLAIIPTFLEIALPLSALLGVMLAFARLSGDSEIVVMRASGIKIVQLLRPVLIFGLFATALTFYVSFNLRPISYRVLDKTLFDIARNQSLSGLKAGVFNRLGNLMIYSEKIDYETGDLENVLIDDKRESERKTIFSKTGTISPNSDGRSLGINLRTGSIHEKPEDKYEVTLFKQNQLILDTADIYEEEDLSKDKRGRELSATEIKSAVKDYERLNLPYLAKYNFAKEINKRHNRLQIELATRYASPWGAMLMAILAISLGIMPPRAQKTWGASFSLLIGLIVFVVYFGLTTFATSMAKSGDVPITLAVWIPNIILAFFCWYTLRKTSSEQWQSVADAFSKTLEKIKFFKKRAT